MKKEPLFYILRNDADEVAGGPYDLVQMAGLLQRKIISAETLTRIEDMSDDWTPFCERPQYRIAKEMPAGMISTRTEARLEEEEISRSPIPLPSRETFVKMAALVGAGVIALSLVGAMIYFLAKADDTLGICLAGMGGLIALVAQIMIFAKIMDEDFLTIAGIFFIPFFDVFYFLSRFDDYLPYFAAKYVGIAFTVAATAGMAASSSPNASAIRDLFHH